MIKKYDGNDIENILSIWLEASIKAHDFVAAEYWKSQVPNIRDIYIPASETYVYIQNSETVGFYSLVKNDLAAIFVSPKNQGQGIGKALLFHAKAQREELTLSVYSENEASYQFYLSQDFTVIEKQTDIHTGHQEYKMRWVAKTEI
jgi:putative acetyltransferase